MTGVTDSAEPGLRERKRRATRRAIQLAVLTLVKERGLDGVTVDEASRLADISPRTFFNYFDSKEEAVLGDPPELPSDAIVDRFITAADGDTLVEGLVALLSAASEATMADAELIALRHSLVKDYPHLFALRMAKLRTFEDELTEVITRRLENDDRTSDPVERESRARLITLVAFGVMRHAWARWAGTGSSSNLAEQLRHSFALFAAVFGSPAPVDAGKLG